MKNAPRSRPARRATAEGPVLSLRKKLIFSGVAVLGVLLLMEGVARLVTSVVPSAAWSLHSQLVVAVGFGDLNKILVPDPDRFWTTKPKVTSLTMSGTIADGHSMRFTVSTDAEGCRLVPSVPGARGSIAFLGDSTTFGVGVDDAQTYPARLQDQLQGVQAVNLGVPGYSAYQGRLRLQSYPFRTPVKAVVVTFGFNDDAPWSNRGDLEFAAELASDRDRLVNRSRLLSLMGRFLRSPASDEDFDKAPSNPRPRLTDQEFVAEIERIVSWSVERHAVPILLVWPQRPQLALRDQYTSKQQALFEIGARDSRVRVVNLVEVFQNKGGEALLADIVHANAEGNATVARVLEMVMRNSRMLGFKSPLMGIQAR